MFGKTAPIYDRLYAARGKDFAAEARTVAAAIRERVPDAKTLLDAGCGTGAHLETFAQLGFECRGIDVDPEMVSFARSRLPDVEIDVADMTTFALEERFDAIVCLFGALAYSRVEDKLRRTVANFAKHLVPGGVIVAEGWLGVSKYRSGFQDLITLDAEDLKVARMSLARQVGHVAVIDFHYLVGKPSTGIERFFNRHELGLFEDPEYESAFELAGLTVDVLSELQPEYERTLFRGSKPK